MKNVIVLDLDWWAGNLNFSANLLKMHAYSFWNPQWSSLFYKISQYCIFLCICTCICITLNMYHWWIYTFDALSCAVIGSIWPAEWLEPISFNTHSLDFILMLELGRFTWLGWLAHGSVSSDQLMVLLLQLWSWWSNLSLASISGLVGYGVMLALTLLLVLPVAPELHHFNLPTMLTFTNHLCLADLSWNVAYLMAMMFMLFGMVIICLL